MSHVRRAMERRQREEWWIGLLAILCCLCIVVALCAAIYGIWFETTMIPSVKIISTACIIGAIAYAALNILED